MAKTDKKIKLILQPSKIEDLITHIEDLNRINDTLKLKIDHDYIHLYSMLGESVMLAFKNFILPTKEYFTGAENLDFTLNIIIINTKKFVKNLKFLKNTEKVEWEIAYQHVNNEKEGEARMVQIKNGKFKLTPPCGENMEIRDLTRERIGKFQNIANVQWSFNLTKSDFADVKQLATINNDENKKIINIESTQGKVVMSEEANWELEVDTISDLTKYNIIFNKTFLASIKNQAEQITFHVFENFILLKEENESLMISFEQTFD